MPDLYTKVKLDHPPNYVSLRKSFGPAGILSTMLWL